MNRFFNCFKEHLVMPLILLLRKLILGKEAFYYKGDHSQVTLRLTTLPLLRECSIVIHQ